MNRRYRWCFYYVLAFVGGILRLSARAFCPSCRSSSRAPTNGFGGADCPAGGDGDETIRYHHFGEGEEVVMFESSTSGDRSSKVVGRRVFFVAVGTALAGLVFRPYSRPAAIEASPAPSGPPKQVSIVEFTNAGVRKETVSVPKIQKTDAEWKSQLSPASFEVARHEGTERPFSGELLNVHDKGVFRCICCDTALFSSDTKYESGTGWPSFWAPIAKENIVESGDASLGMDRTAVSCRRCDAHLGHVFDDGPKPTGLRYCMNSVSLKFAAA
jgi:peptide-methionine (R)-S-oxide reductase